MLQILCVELTKEPFWSLLEIFREMGGESVRTEDESSSADPEFSRSSSRRCFRDDVRVNDGDSEELGTNPSAKFSSFEADRRKREKVYKDVLQSYDRLEKRVSSLNVTRLRVLSYTPGAWVERAEGVKLSDYDVPETTSVILVGPKGSGKSSLINKIIRVIEDDWFAPDRAQVSYGSSSEEGTFFLQEYKIPRAFPSFSLYDTRGLSQNSSDNVNAIKRWITKGVCHAEPVIWKSDSPSVKEMMNLKAHGLSSIGCKTKKINSVIFVVNAVDVLKSMESTDSTHASYAQMISTAFNCPFLSFKDDKPVIVMTHGDVLSRVERIRARMFLGDLLGVPPDKQVFDIPESRDKATELIICDLLRHCLEHADKNIQILPSKNSKNFEVRGVIPWTILTSSIMLLVLVLTMGYHYHAPMGHAPLNHAPNPNATVGHAPNPNATMGHAPKPKSRKRYARRGDAPNLDWGKMRHLWLDET